LLHLPPFFPSFLRRPRRVFEPFLLHAHTRTSPRARHAHAMPIPTSGPPQAQKNHFASPSSTSLTLEPCPPTRTLLPAPRIHGQSQEAVARQRIGELVALARRPAHPEQHGRRRQNQGRAQRR
jgi:hypothetical protein